MKKLIIFLCTALISFYGCTNLNSETNNILNCTTFLELLEENDFNIVSIEEDEQRVSGFFNVPQKLVNIDNGQLAVYEFDSISTMESHSGFVSKEGFSISRPDPPEQEDEWVTVQISWVSDPYWFKKDLLIVNYVGTDQRIINFLHENFKLFAGHGYQ